jgi:hypothetical protein
MRSSSFASSSSLASLVVVAALSGAGCADEPSDLEPPCADPAELLGEFDPAAPGYVVKFHDDVAAEVESSRLAAAYDFEVTTLYTAVLRGFAAEFDADVQAQLRCEPSVVHVAYNGVVSVD